MQDKTSQRKKTCFTGNGCLGTAFFFIGKVEFFHIRQFFSGFDGCSELVGQFALSLNLGQNRFLAVQKSRQRLVHINNGLDLRFIKIACFFLTVTGNKGNGIAFCSQFQNGFNLLFFQAQFLSQCFKNTIFHKLYYTTIGDLLGEKTL